MAYMRGKHYVYCGDKVEFLSPDVAGGHAAISQELLGIYVVMRYNELLHAKGDPDYLGAKKLEKFERKVFKEYFGNFGCDGLSMKFFEKSVLAALEETIKDKTKGRAFKRKLGGNKKT